MVLVLELVTEETSLLPCFITDEIMCRVVIWRFRLTVDHPGIGLSLDFEERARESFHACIIVSNINSFTSPILTVIAANPEVLRNS